MRLAAGIALAAAACDDPTGPEPFDGTWVLTAVDGQGPAPFTVIDHTFSTGQRLVTRILAESLVVRDAEHLQRSEWWSGTYYEADGTSRSSDPAGQSYPARYTRRGDSVFVEARSLSNPSVTWTDTLLMNGRSLARHELVGLWCQEGCPEPRLLEFRLDRR